MLNADDLPLEALQRELQAQADDAYREQLIDRYGLPAGSTLGVRLPVLRSLARRYYDQLSDLQVDERLMICGSLLERPVHELKLVALHWSRQCVPDCADHHIRVFLSWLERHISDPLCCDHLCVHTLGEFLHLHPVCIPEVKQWAFSSNKWKRRAAAQSMVYFARRGEYLPHVFEVADLLRRDENSGVQGAFGSLLREVSHLCPDDVFEYLMSRRHTMAQRTLSRAAEKLGDEQRRRILQDG